MTVWGPKNPHPLSRMKTELVWEGKYDEYGERRPVHLPQSPLPLQRIESIDAPHDYKKAQEPTLFNEAEFYKEAHRDDWRNMLIWGDNKLVMHALLERFRGKIDLIYIDPPFDVGADFTVEVQIGENGHTLEKEPSILETVAYRDTWGKGTDSYLHMMYERLSLMRDLLSERGSIYVHCDWRVNALLRLMLDEIFGRKSFINEIIWCYRGGGVPKTGFAKKHDTILWFSKSPNAPITFNPQFVPYSEASQSLVRSRGGVSIDNRKRDLERGAHMPDWWNDINSLQTWSPERVGFVTQKPEALLERIIKASSKEGDLVADFFCGSGTTLAVAEKLGRRWIGVDLGRYAIHTTRKRLIQVQRELYKKGQRYRPFDVYNLGRYERQWWQESRLKGADDEHRRVVLSFYKATELVKPPHPLLHGTKDTAYVHVAPIDSIFTYKNLEEVAKAVYQVGGGEVHCLAWEFEMDLDRKRKQLEAQFKIGIRLKYIPREIMEPGRTEVTFFDMSVVEAKVICNKVDGKTKVGVKLLNFIPSFVGVPEKELDELKKRAAKSPFDFIDFWAVDFEYAPNKPFEHHWQDFRTRKDRSLRTSTGPFWDYEKEGEYKIGVKVIDVFGVDTTIELNVRLKLNSLGEVVCECPQTCEETETSSSGREGSQGEPKEIGRIDYGA